MADTGHLAALRLGRPTLEAALARAALVAFVVLMVALVGYCFQLSKLKQADQREQFAYSYRAA